MRYQYLKTDALTGLTVTVVNWKKIYKPNANKHMSLNDIFILFCGFLWMFVSPWMGAHTDNVKDEAQTALFKGPVRTAQ